MILTQHTMRHGKRGAAPFDKPAQYRFVARALYRAQYLGQGRRLTSRTASTVPRGLGWFAAWRRQQGLHLFRPEVVLPRTLPPAPLSYLRRLAPEPALHRGQSPHPVTSPWSAC